MSYKDNQISKALACPDIDSRMDGNISSFTNKNQTPDCNVCPRISDPFLFYSIDENIYNAMNLKPIDYSNDGSKSNTPITRKTRISFEKDALSLMIKEIMFD